MYMYKVSPKRFGFTWIRQTQWAGVLKHTFSCIYHVKGAYLIADLLVLCHLL